LLLLTLWQVIQQVCFIILQATFIHKLDRQKCEPALWTSLLLKSCSWINSIRSEIHPYTSNWKRAWSSIVVKALSYEPEGHGSETQWGEWISSIYLILLAALGPGIYSASNRNEYRSRKIMFLGSKVRPMRRTDNLTAICELIV
jgi:hypothetical protein